MQTPEELAGPHLAHFNELYAKLNPMGREELEAANIAAFLKTASGVNVAQLSQIWEIASELSGCSNRAALNRLGTFICFKLVSAAQQGFGLSPAVLSNPSLGPPQFDFQMDQVPPHRPPFGSKSPSIASELGGGQQQQQEMGWAISPEEQRKYEAIFDSLGPLGGRLSGEQCRPVLLNSQLPKAQLAKIWELADMDADGHLDRPEFCVALHLVYKSLQNEPLPERLPLALVPFVKRPIMRQMSVRSVEPQMGHPPPLTWSSRASSVASLNFQPPPAPVSPPNLAQRRGSLFEKNVEEWRPDNLGQFEAEFVGLDKDNDGLVTGGDIREVFLRSGLAQSTLARIWAHVDVQQRGRLNLEQYAKCVLLIRECQEGEGGGRQPMAAASPPPPSLPPPIGVLARRDSQISTNSSTGTKLGLAENPRVQELTAAIEEMQTNRRQAEQDLFQAEADLKVKNSEVKNMEIELLTLEATVKQLRNQRVEANKRLNDLDTRIAKLEGVCVESEKRLEEEESRLGRTKLDIQQARDNSDQEAGLLEQLRGEVQAKREGLARAREAFSGENHKFEGFVDELTQLERGMSRQEEEGLRLRGQMEEMRRILEGVDRDEEGAKEDLLAKTFQGPRENLTALKPANGQKNAALPFPDPFKEEDPFESGARGGGGPSIANPTTADDPFAPKSSSPEEQPSQAAGQFANFANFSSFS